MNFVVAKEMKTFELWKWGVLTTRSASVTLTKGKILSLLELKTFANSKLNITQKLKFLFKSGEWRKK